MIIHTCTTPVITGLSFYDLSCLVFSYLHNIFAIFPTVLLMIILFFLILELPLV